MKRIGKIYKHTNKLTGKVYIGKTFQNEHRRWRKESKTYNSYANNPYMLNTLQKYGWDVFDSEVIACCIDNSYINELEAYFIELYNCIAPNGYNIKVYDECNREAHSEETKRKLSLIKLGKPRGYDSWNLKHNIIENNIEKRHCPKCDKYKPLSDYGKAKKISVTGKLNPNQTTNYCKPCKNQYQKENFPYKRKDPKEVKQSYKERGKKSSEFMKQYFGTKEAKRAKSLTYGGYKGINTETGQVIQFECGYDLKKTEYKLPAVCTAIQRNKPYKGYIWSKL